MAIVPATSPRRGLRRRTRNAVPSTAAAKMMIARKPSRWAICQRLAWSAISATWSSSFPRANSFGCRMLSISSSAGAITSAAAVARR